MVASLRDKKSLRFATVDLIFSFIDLEPDGCLVADQFRIRTKTFEITGAVNEKGLIQLWMMSLQKKTVLFCDGEVFSLDRGLLMGASISTLPKLQICR